MKNSRAVDEYEYFCTDCRGAITPNDKTCPHCGADTSEFIEEDEDSFEELDEEILPQKYPALRVIATLYQGVAALFVIVTLFSLYFIPQQVGGNPIISIGYIVLGLIGVVTFLALSEGIKVFIDMEHGIRRIAQVLENREREKRKTNREPRNVSSQEAVRQAHAAEAAKRIS